MKWPVWVHLNAMSVLWPTGYFGNNTILMSPPPSIVWLRVCVACITVSFLLKFKRYWLQTIFHLQTGIFCASLLKKGIQKMAKESQGRWKCFPFNSKLYIALEWELTGPCFTLRRRWGIGFSIFGAVKISDENQSIADRFWKRLRRDDLFYRGCCNNYKNLHSMLFGICISASLGYTWHAPSAVAFLCVRLDWKVQWMSESDCRGRWESCKELGRKIFMIIELLLVVGVKSACVCNPLWQRTRSSLPSRSDSRPWD